MKQKSLGVKARKRIGSVVYHCFMVLLSLTMIYPFVWSVLSSFKTSEQLYGGSPLDLLPKPVIALLAAGFLGVDLSSFAVMALAPATLISHDMYTLYKPNATEKQKSTLSRVIIIIIGIVSIAICNFQPAVVDMVNWCFSFGIPVFIMGVIGLWWKRSTKASVITFIITWIVVCIWSTFGLQNALGWANFHVNYI